VNFMEEIASTEGVAGQFVLPHTDQDGFQDEAGNAYKNWYYTATIQYQTDRATLPAKTKTFQLTSGQTVVDLDLLPTGVPAMPYTAPVAGVTSVNGQTGSVLVEGATDAAVAEQVTSGPETVAALSATIGTAVAPKLDRSKLGWEAIQTQNYKALQPWFAALGNRDTTPAKVIWLGDSVTEGLGASARPGTKRYIDKVLSRLRTKYPTTGIGAGGGLGYYPTQYAGGTALSAVTYGGTTTADLTASGLGLRSRILDSTDDYVQWTVTGTSVDLLYQKKSATAVLGWSVDGGAVTNLETMGSGGADTGSLRITLGASGSHTVRVAYVSGAPVQPEGVYVFDGDETKGIHIYEAGHHSYEASHFIPAGNDSPIIRMASINANLLVIALGENEFLHNKTSASLRANLVSIVTKLKSYTNPDPAIMFVINMEAKYATPLEPWANYVTAIYGAASDTAAAVVDMSLRMPTIGSAEALALGLYGDDYHLNDKGNAMFTEPLVEALSPR
jgi:hypothetical protein